MRGNTNPCNVCEYCDGSCDVCLHQPYEDTVAARYCEASSSSEDEARGGEDASSEADWASDEEGSWFTTPWSRLVAQRVAGYEVDPAVGVQLEPLEAERDVEEDQEAEQSVKEEKHRREQEAVAEGEGAGESARGRRRRVRRRRRRERRSDSPAAAANDEAPPHGPESPSANDEAASQGPEGPAANDEAPALFSVTPAPAASAPAPDGGDALPKDTDNNMWRATVHSYVSVVSVS